VRYATSHSPRSPAGKSPSKLERLNIYTAHRNTLRIMLESKEIADSLIFELLGIKAN
jgi:hypothetical protein